MSKTGSSERARQKLPSIFSLLNQTAVFIRGNWRSLGSVLAVYIAIDLVFGNGLSTIRDAINNFNSSSDRLASLGNLIGIGANSGGTSTSALPGFLSVIMLMVFILLIKQLAAGKWLGVKETYYRCMYPLVPFLLVVAVIILQLLPMALGSLILVSVFGGSPGTLAAVVFTAIFIALSAWSIYMLSSSIFALFIVTEPESQPLKAFAKAKMLVAGRRWQIVVRILPLPFLMFAAAFLVLLPVALIAKSLAPPLFYLLEVCALPIAAVYSYFLHTELAE